MPIALTRPTVFSLNSSPVSNASGRKFCGSRQIIPRLSNNGRSVKYMSNEKGQKATESPRRFSTRLRVRPRAVWIGGRFNRILFWGPVFNGQPPPIERETHATPRYYKSLLRKQTQTRRSSGYIHD